MAVCQRLVCNNQTINKYIHLTGILLLTIAYISLGMIPIKEKVPKIKPIDTALDFSNITMCAPINRFNISMKDIAKSKRPLAPKLFPKWQTKMSITSQSAEAKQFFNQGLFYLYAFNHAEADRAFKEAIRLDATCAMCHWGVALGLGPNINMPMTPDKNADAYAFSQKALAFIKYN